MLACFIDMILKPEQILGDMLLRMEFLLLVVIFQRNWEARLVILPFTLYGKITMKASSKSERLILKVKLLLCH